DISSGELWIDGKLCNYVESKDRNLSMVFQNYALYPYMNVYENIAFGQKMKKVDKNSIDLKVKEVAKMLSIDHLLDRKPNALSGGQKQRVAIASVLALSPNLYLMDEPLSNLDAKLRMQMRVELARLHKEMKTTVIYVTHDQTEAMTLGTKIVVLKDGIIQQVDTPKNLYRNPINKFVAGFIGSPSMNFIECKLRKNTYGYFLEFWKQKIALSDQIGNALEFCGYINKQMILGVRPEDIEVTKEENNSLSIKIEVKEMLGHEVLLHGLLDETSLIIKEKKQTKINANDIIHVRILHKNIRFFDIETEENIIGGF
ncbi:MAG: ABC transporter ATP-binding protein, partial [Lachnospiraceae bacterium]